MIQRIQSIYLLIGIVIGIGFLVFYDALHSIPLQIGWSVTVLLLLAAIITYKNRRLQIILSIIAGVTLLVTHIYQALNFQDELQLLWTGIGSLMFYVFLFLAIRNIQKDEKLIKETNRLR
jgi:ABC-type Fe3+ transport system permease subunit